MSAVAELGGNFISFFQDTYLVGLCLSSSLSRSVLICWRILNADRSSIWVRTGRVFIDGPHTVRLLSAVCCCAGNVHCQHHQAAIVNLNSVRSNRETCLDRGTDVNTTPILGLHHFHRFLSISRVLLLVLCRVSPVPLVVVTRKNNDSSCFGSTLAYVFPWCHKWSLHFAHWQHK